LTLAAKPRGIVASTDLARVSTIKNNDPSVAFADPRVA
jgi:hypothetical protein